MAEPAYLTGAASPARAAYIVDLIGEAAAIAAGHFDKLPPGEEATAAVTLTAATGYGVITLGIWTFNRDSNGKLLLAGVAPEDTDG